nr:DUF3085 domain-containing protein [Komagataeibacter xylinus]
MKLHFDHALAARLLAHAQAASEHSPTYDQLVEPVFLKAGVSSRHPIGADVDRTKIPAGLMLVGDHGVYLMSNGYPGFSDAEGQANLVAYTVEADPRTCPDDWYDVNARHLVATMARNFFPLTPSARHWKRLRAIVCGLMSRLRGSVAPVWHPRKKPDPDNRMAALERPNLNRNIIKIKYRNK